MTQIDSTFNEKTGAMTEVQELHTDCNHTTSQTPYIDAALNQFPSIRTTLMSLSTALANIASEKECTKCATDSVTFSLMSASKEIKAAKKSGDWSKEDRKALKNEARSLFKGAKADAREMWKAQGK